MVDFTVDGSEAVQKTVKKAGTGAHVYVPKDWRDESVLVVRLEEPEAEDGMDPDAPSSSTVIEYDAEFDSATAVQTDGKEFFIKGSDSNEPNGVYAGKWPRQLFENARTISDPETYIGCSRTPEMGVQAVSIDREAWMRHTAIFGSSGYGKSTLLKNAMLQWAYGGYGFCYVGTRGAEAEELLRKLPPERLDDVVWVEPITNGQESQNVVGFNFLQPSSDKGDGRVFTVQKGAISDGVQQLIHNDDYWGVRMDTLLSAIAHAMIEAEEPYTLTDLYMVLEDEQYRRNFIDETNNEKAKQYLQDIDSENDSDSYEPLRLRVKSLVQTADMREFIAHPNAETTIDELINDERIVLVNNINGSPKERKISANAIIRQVASAAQTRSTAPAKGRKPFHLVVDDFGSTSPSPNLKELLAKGRSMRLSVTLCCQSPSQLPEETRKTIFGSCDNIISMNVSEPNSARIIMQQFGEYDEEDLMKLGRYKMFVRTVRGEKQSAPFVAETFPSYPPLRSDEETEAVKERSRQRYGVSHLDAEDPIKDTVHGPK